LEFNPLGTPPLPTSNGNGAPCAGMDDGVAGAARFRVHAAHGLWVEEAVWHTAPLLDGLLRSA